MKKSKQQDRQKNKQKNRQKRKLKNMRRTKPVKASEVRLVSYNITREPVSDAAFDALPEEAQDASEQIFHTVHENPQQALSECLKLVEQYPDIAKFRNFLYAAYELSGQPEKAQETVIETYHKFPDYLFGRLNYIEYLMRNDRFDEIPEVLGGVFDLSMLYPERKEFHVSEVTGFFSTMGCYFARTDKIDSARACLSILRNVLDDEAKEVHIVAGEIVKAELRRLSPMEKT